MENKMERLKKLVELAKNDPAFEKEIRGLLKAQDFKAVVRLAGEHGIKLEEADFTAADSREADQAELKNVAGGIGSNVCESSPYGSLCDNTRWGMMR